jgi:Family of unknown function (DUF6176)
MLQLSVRVVHPDQVQNLRAWFGELQTTRRDQAVATLVDETVDHETAVLVAIGADHHLVYAMEVGDPEQARRSADSGRHRIDLEHHEVPVEDAGAVRPHGPETRVIKQAADGQPDGDSMSAASVAGGLRLRMSSASRRAAGVPWSRRTSARTDGSLSELAPPNPAERIEPQRGRAGAAAAGAATGCAGCVPSPTSPLSSDRREAVSRERSRGTRWDEIRRHWAHRPFQEWSDLAICVANRRVQALDQVHTVEVRRSRRLSPTLERADQEANSARTLARRAPVEGPLGT